MSIDAEKVKDASEKLKESVYTARSCTDAGSLRGIEGEAASTYFSVFDELILTPTHVSVSRRETVVRRSTA